jgi:hypothetical protein
VPTFPRRAAPASMPPRQRTTCSGCVVTGAGRARAQGARSHMCNVRAYCEQLVFSVREWPASAACLLGRRCQTPWKVRRLRPRTRAGARGRAPAAAVAGACTGGGSFSPGRCLRCVGCHRRRCARAALGVTDHRRVPGGARAPRAAAVPGMPGAFPPFLCAACRGQGWRQLFATRSLAQSPGRGVLEVSGGSWRRLGARCHHRRLLLARVTRALARRGAFVGEGCAAAALES